MTSCLEGKRSSDLSSARAKGQPQAAAGPHVHARDLGLLEKGPALPVHRASKDNSVGPRRPLPMTIFVCQGAAGPPSGNGQVFAQLWL